MKHSNRTDGFKRLNFEELKIISGGCNCVCRINQGPGWHLRQTASIGAQPDLNACSSACISLGHGFFSCT